MSSAADYERYRQGLEDQLRADVDLLYRGYLAKLRAYELLVHPVGSLGIESLLPTGLALCLPSGEAPAPMPPAPAPPAPRRAKAFEVEEAVEGVLSELPDVFTKLDLLRRLSFTPRPSTLYRALDNLLHERVLAVELRGGGHNPTLYRKLASPASS